MAFIYVTPGLTTGSNNGTSPENAFRSWSDFLAVGGASGDEALVNADEIITSSLSFVGTRLNGVIIRGVSADWATTQNRVIDANSANINGLVGIGLNGVVINSITWTRFNSNIITNVTTASPLIRLLNCRFTLSSRFCSYSSGTGLGQIVATNCLISNMVNAANFGSAAVRTIFTNCKFINHTNYIIGGGVNIQLHKCSFLNSNGGLSSMSTVLLHDCVFDSLTNICINTTSIQEANNVLFSRCGRVFSVSSGRPVVSNLSKYNVILDDDLGTGALYFSNDGNGNAYKILTELPFKDADNGNYNLKPFANVKSFVNHGTENTTKLFMSAGLPSDNTLYPDITSITPSAVSEAGGTEITIAMENGGATGATSVTVGGTACTGIVVDSDTQLRATTPAKTAAQYDVVVVSPAGTATAVKGVTAQAGASAPGAFTLSATSKARGVVLLKWTPSTGFNSYDVYVNGSIPTGYSDLVVCEKLITLTADSSNTIYVKAKNGTGNTDSNTLTVATGKSASIVAGITNNIVQELQQITIANGYTFTVNTVEQERMTERINGRLPMLEVCGPAVSIETKTTRGQQYTTGYSIIYRALINDDALTDDPATKQTEDIAADIIMALMDDYTHGGLAIMTTVTDYYHTLDEAANGTTMFNVIVTFEILTHVDMFNPYKIG